MSAGGKGSTQRPTDPQKYGESYDRIFGKKPEPKKDDKPNLAAADALMGVFGFKRVEE